MFSYKAVHGDLIHISQDHDNSSIVGNYLRDVEKILLVCARSYLVGIEPSSLVLGQIVGVVHILVCSTLVKFQAIFGLCILPILFMMLF